MLERLHFKTQPEPGAKNATPRPSAGNWTHDAGSLHQRSTDRATEAITISLRGSEFCKYTGGNVSLQMPVKYTGVK